MVAFDPCPPEKTTKTFDGDRRVLVQEDDAARFQPAKNSIEYAIDVARAGVKAARAPADQLQSTLGKERMNKKVFHSGDGAKQFRSLAGDVLQPVAAVVDFRTQPVFRQRPE